MARLVDALHALGLEGDVEFGGRWVRLRGQRCRVNAVEATSGDGYFVWCDDPAEQTIEHHRDPVTAILSGLRRAARSEPGLDDEEGGNRPVR